MRAASRAKCSGGLVSKNSGPMRPPPPALPSRRTPLSRAMTETRMEKSGWTSSTSTPTEFAMRTCLVSSARVAIDLLDARVVGARPRARPARRGRCARPGRARRRCPGRSGGRRGRARPPAAATVRRVGGDVGRGLARRAPWPPARGRRCTRSPCARRDTTRTPRPQVTPAEAVRMIPSSSRSDEVRWCSK